MFSAKRMSDAAARRERRAWMESPSSRSRSREGRRGWGNCGRNCGRVNTVREPSVGCGYPNREGESVRWGSRRSKTEWCKWRWCLWWLRYSKPTSARSRWGFDRVATRRPLFVYYQVRQKGRSEVVDADLSDYFNTIPHGALLRSLGRRISDGTVLSVIRAWLKAPVEEQKRGRGNSRTTEAKDASRGTPQGGVISPLLANLYFRRFILAWKKFGWDQRTRSVIVNYADDFVICCRPGNGKAAHEAMTRIMEKLGLTVNERKTRLVNVPEGSFDFLGYTFGRFYGRGGAPYTGTRPSKKALQKLLQAIHDETTAQWHASEPEVRTAVINQKLRGWAVKRGHATFLDSYKTTVDACLPPSLLSLLTKVTYASGTREFVHDLRAHQELHRSGSATATALKPATCATTMTGSPQRS